MKLSYVAPLLYKLAHPHPMSELPQDAVLQTLGKGGLSRRKRPQMSSDSRRPRMMRTDRAHWTEQPEVGEVRGESGCGGWMETTDVGLQKGKE